MKMNRVQRAFGVAMLVVAVGIPGGIAEPALADDHEVLTVPVTTVVRGAEGDIIEVAKADVPRELVGLTCEVSGETRNQRSVHRNNDLLIDAGSEDLIIENFEREGDLVETAGVVETLDAVVRLSVRLGPDGISSGAFRVILRCEPDRPDRPEPRPEVPVTSPAEATPTDVPATTPVTTPSPTVPVAPSTMVPPPTVPATPVPPVSVPSTVEVPTPTVPEQPIPTSVVPTTTPPPPAPPATSPPTTISVDPVPEEKLPVTGSNSLVLVAIGAVLVAVGAGLMRTVAPSRRS